MSAWWSHNRQLILRLAGTLLAIFLLLFLLRDEGWNEILAATNEIKTVDLLRVALLFAVSRLAVVLRWHILLVSGGAEIRFRNSLALTFMGLFAGNFLPTTIGGDLVRLAGVMQMGFDRAVSFASLAADRLIGMFGMAMSVPIGLAYSWNLLPVVGPGAALLTPLFHKPVAFLRRMVSIFSIWVKKPLSLLAALACTWVHMLCLFSSIYVFVDDLGSHVSFWMIAGLCSLTYFITLIPISINGYGLQELSFTFLLSHVAGLTPAVSLTIAVLIRAYFLLFSLPGAIFLPSILSAIAKQKTAISSPEPLF